MIGLRRYVLFFIFLSVVVLGAIIVLFSSKQKSFGVRLNNSTIISLKRIKPDQIFTERTIKTPIDDVPTDSISPLEFEYPEEIKCGNDSHFVTQTIVPSQINRTKLYEWVLITPVGVKFAFRVYNAYLDYRQNKLALITYFDWDWERWTKKFNPVFNLTCLLFDSKLSTMKYSTIHQYTQYLVYCDIPEGFDPDYVVVIKNQTCNESHVYWLIPIDKVSLEHRKPQGEFAICVNRLYGVSQNYLLFIQFVETYRIYGVSHFYVYVDETTPLMKEILKYYVKTGNFTLIPWRVKTWAEFVRVSLAMNNDCVYRLMYRYQLAMTTDFDEFHQVNHCSFMDWMRKKFADAKLASLYFSTRYIPIWANQFLEFMPSQKPVSLDWVRAELPYNRFVNMSAPGPPSFTGRSVWRPEGVRKMWVHWVQEVITGYHKLDANPKTGYMRHYRNYTPFDQHTRDVISNFGKWDPTGDRDEDFAQELETKVLGTIRDLQNLVETEFFQRIETPRDTVKLRYN